LSITKPGAISPPPSSRQGHSLGDLTDSDDLGRKMMCQVAGAFAEYEKGRLVAKLRSGRERKRGDW
jgi:hypothetical protein